MVYNVAVLIGPDGSILGKYRKVCLPRGEIEDGVMPGDSYPVFQAPFGKVGLMVCYDGFFPEVARELANNGAEVIAFPVGAATRNWSPRGPARITSTSSAAPTPTPTITG